MKKNTLVLGIILSLLLVVSLSLIGLILHDLNSYDESYFEGDLVDNAEQTLNVNSDNLLIVDNTEKKVDEIKQEDKIDSAYLAKIELLPEETKTIVKEHVSKTKKKMDLSAPVVANEVVKQAQNLNRDVRVIVALKDVAFKQNVLSSLTPEEFELKIDGSDWFAGMINNNSLSKLENNVLVSALEIDRKMRTATAQSFPLINSTIVTNKEILGVTVNGTNHNVCLIDSGINFAHTELGGDGNFPGTKVIEGYDYCGGSVNPCGADDATPQDLYGHGTGQASIIGADSATFKGMAPGTKFVALKVTADNIAFTSNIIKGVEWCVNNASKFNLSVMYIGLASTNVESDQAFCVDALYNKIQLAVNANMTVVAPSGNGGSIDGISGPACKDNVISVGGVEDGPPLTADKFWNDSNRHAILDMLAPADRITHLALVGQGDFEGTSEAAAHVAGAAVLLKDFYQQKYNIILHHNQTERILKKTGINITDPVTGLQWPRLDVWRAINYEEYAPNILLLTANNSVFNQNVQLLYNASDDHNLYNCTLFVNDVANQTNVSLPSNTVLNYSLTLGSGNYTWKVQCYDNSTFPNVNTSLVNTFRVDADAPLVKLESPLNNSVLIANPVVFNYNVTDAYNILNCTLFINSTANKTNTTVLTGVTQNFTVNLTDGNYNWLVKCYDNVSNLGVSLQSNLVINIPPAWNPEPSNQVIEFATAFSYTIIAADTDTLIYKINDTVNFTINSATGNIKNNTLLAVGVYNLKANATDTANSFVEKIFTITVQDTTNPVFTTGIASQTKEFALAGVSQNIVATDAAGVTYAVNDTNFSINGAGLLTNNTQLAVRLYNIKVTATDANNNAATSVGVITVSDTVVPVFTTSVASQTKEFALAGVSQNIVATDVAGVTYAVNDTNFTINGAGLLTNNTQLAVGIYNVKVTATDANNNAATSVGVITVSDTIVPVFTTGVASQTREFATQGVSQNIVATDVAGITYAVNDSNFTINGAGLLTNATQLAVRLYNVKVTATDNNNNAATSVGVITVSDTVVPVFTTGVATQTKEFALAGVSQNIVATDVAGVTYSVNDTNFTINGAGLLTNATQLAVRLYNIKVTATDANNNAATSVGVITVSDTTIPVFTTGVTTETKEFALAGVLQNIVATDATGVTYSVNDTNFSINGAGLLTNATQLAVRIYNVKVTATDNNNNVATSVGVITVSDTTLPTWTTAPSNQNINLNQSFAVTVTAADSNTPIIYSINDTTNFTINAATGEIKNNTGLAFDTYNLLVTAKDNSNNAVTGTMAVIVGNNPPTITGLIDYIKAEDFGLIDNLIDLHAFANDLNTAVNLLTFSITSQSNNSVANCAIDNNKFVDCTTQLNKNGINDVTVRVTDPQTAFAEDTFRLTITALNDAPTVTTTALTPALANTNTLFTCAGSGAADVEGDTLTHAYRFSDGGGQLQAYSAVNTLDCSTVAGCDKADIIICEYKVNDGTIDSNVAASTGVAISNSAPTLASASLIPATAVTNTVFTCAANTVNDVDGDVVALQYQFEDTGGILQTFSAGNTLDCSTVTGCDKGDTITCKAKGNDGSADSNIVSSNIVSVSNTAPTVASATLTPTTTNTNTLFTCAGSGASDADGDSLTNLYQFKDAAGILQVFSATATFNCGTVTGCDLGDAITCEYKANDGSADSNVIASNTVNIVDMPDLFVEQLQVRSPVAPTTTADSLIKFIIRNIGNVDANNVQWKLDFQDGIHTQPDTPTIKAGEFLLVYDYVRFTNAGMHTLTATADQNNNLNELDETNNAQSIQKNVS